MDLQFVLLQDALELTGVQEVPGIEPRSLRIVGVDFQHAVEVRINDSKSPSFVVASNREIIAQVPSDSETSTILSVSVLSAAFTATFRSKISFHIGDDPKSVGGLHFLMQAFLRILLTTPGTDSFAKMVGGNALASVGSTYGINSGSIVSEFSVAVSRTASQLRTMQSRQGGLSEDERLLSANVVNIRFDPATTTLVARVELIPASGRRAIVNLEL